MAASLAQIWQQFKKKHPMMEQSKKFKSDVSPQLARFDKAREELEDMQKALEKKATEVLALGKALTASFKDYDEVVKELHTADKSIKSDYAAQKFDDFNNVYVKKYGKKIDWD